MIQVGKTYQMTHTRKGVAVVDVESVSGEFAKVRVINGRLRGVHNSKEWTAGDLVTVKVSLAKFNLVGKPSGAGASVWPPDCDEQARACPAQEASE